VNKPGGESAMGQKSQGVNKPGGEPAKGQKSHNSLLLLLLCSLQTFILYFYLSYLIAKVEVVTPH